MGKCVCGFTADIEGNCDGNHKIARKVRKQIVQDIKSKITEESLTMQKVIFVVEDL